MGQKVNPIAVRLNLNRFPNSNWFSDYYYSTILHQDLNFQNYINSVKLPSTNKLGFRTAKCIIHHFPKRSVIHLFCLSDLRKRKFNSAKFDGPSAHSLRRTSWKAFRASSDNKSFNEEDLLDSNNTLLPSYLLFSENNEKKEARTSQHHLFKKTSTKIRVSNRNVEHFASLSSNNDLIKVKALDCFNKHLFFHLLRTYFSNVSDFSSNWLTSTVSLQRRKALVNIFRRKASLANIGKISNRKLEDAKQFFGDSVPFFEKTLDYKSSALQPRWSHRITPNTTRLGKNIFTREIFEKVDQKNVFPFSFHTSLFPEVSKEASDWNGASSFLNFYTMHFYFLQKVNSSSMLGLHEIRSNKDKLSFLAPTPCLEGENQIINTSYCKQSFYLLFPSSVFYNKQPRISTSFNFYLSHINLMFSHYSGVFISSHPIKVQSIFQCAFLVAQEIACKLEQKRPFRFICRLIFQQLSVCSYIKGVRIVCSGRINGAEIAKTECRKFGETSLHVFSDKIDYAKVEASTPYGILGIKVWISYT